MATYVLSDIHGHLKAFDEVLSMVSPTADDRLFLLGDMVDRGPDPVGVMRLAKRTDNLTVLAGNHEQIMLGCLAAPTDKGQWDLWMHNGGQTTALGLMGLVPEVFEAMTGWLRDLPLFEVVTVGGRPYVLVHAGIRPVQGAPDGGVWDERALTAMLQAQDPETLLWVRQEFWDAPTGLGGTAGPQPLVVAGHTPTTYLPYVTGQLDGPVTDGDGRAQMVFVGGDKLAIDCAAAAGYGEGQVGCVRLDDGERFYAPVREGE